MKIVRLLIFGLMPLVSFAQTNTPGVPTGLTAVAESSDSIRLSWNNGPGPTPTGYTIERGETLGGPFFTYTVLGYARNPTYSDKGVGGGRQYCYRVRSQTSSTVYSNFTTAVCATTPLSPSNVINFIATATGNSSIKLSWKRYGKDSGILIQRRTGQSGNWSTVASTLADNAEYTDNGLSSSTEYCYRIAETYHFLSTTVCAKTNAPPVVPPITPSGLSILVISDAQLQIFWNDSNVQSVTFELEQAEKPGGLYKVVGTNLTAKIFDDKGLGALKQYCYRVRAKNGSGLYSNFSNEVCGTTKAPPVPSAPARLVAAAASPSQINLQWADASDNETGFQVERADDSPTANFNKIADLGANTTTFSDQNLSASRQYCYRVRAVNGSGPSNFTDNACATTQAPPVGIPQNLAASVVSSSQINLTWNAVAGANSYQLERSPNGNDPWEKIADPAGNDTRYEDKNRTPDTRYYYRIRAVVNGNVSGYSNRADAATPDVAPAAPARLVATAVSYSQINLQWADVSNNESGFQVERSPNGNDSWTKIADPGANSTTYSDQSVQPQTQYFYRVRAVNAAGPSAFSDPANATTPVGPPAKPQNLVATAASTTQINLTWTAIATAANVLIERSPDGSNNWSQIADLPGVTTTFEDKNLSQNTRYYYRIRAKNASGTSPFSDVANATTPDAPPAAPARLVATTASVSQINLSWADLSANESSFEVERGSSTTDTFSKVASLPANTTTYEDKNLTDNTPYCYRIRAGNAAGNSAFTEVVCATTPLAPPAAPTDLTAGVSDYDQIQLNWTPLGPKAVTVVIERSTNPSGPFTEIKRQPASQTGYTDPGLAEFTTYYYQIKAINAAGMSGYSKVASARIEEIVDGVEDEWATHTTLIVSERRLYIVTDWFSPIAATVHLHAADGRPVITDSRKVQPADRWDYALDTLPAGIYIVNIVADGRRFTKRILLP